MRSRIGALMDTISGCVDGGGSLDGGEMWGCGDVRVKGVASNGGGLSNPLEYTMHSITKGRRARTALALAGFWLSYGVDMELVVEDGGLIGA